MYRRFWLILSVLLVAILGMSACAPVPAAPAQPPERSRRRRAAESHRGAGRESARDPALGLLGQPRRGGQP